MKWIVLWLLAIFMLPIASIGIVVGLVIAAFNTGIDVAKEILDWATK